MGAVKQAVRRALRSAGLDLVRYTKLELPRDFDPDLVATIEAVQPFTMTTPELLEALWRSVRWIADTSVPGAVVECGVWRGGSMMAAARTLLERNDVRDLYLFDTFAGMPPPTAEDKFSAYDGYDPMGHWRRRRRGSGDASSWHEVSVDEVRANVLSTGYPPERVHMVQGRVEDTLPGAAPDAIALLRLDTDWYESTRVEMEHLYPLLSPGGVLLLDDYGHYEGARRAVDEYLAAAGERLLLSRVDYTGRMAVKPERSAQPPP